MKPLADKFWKKVEVKTPSECWEWQAAKDRWGYGRMGYEGKSYNATHISLFLQSGSLPQHGTVIMHSCDNPACVNPNHLRIGTHAENAADRSLKGRNGASRGSSHHSAKLTEAQVQDIRNELSTSNSRPLNKIAASYGVSNTAISKIKFGRSWK